MASKKALTCFHYRQVGHIRRNCLQRAGSSGTSKDVQDLGIVTLKLEGDDIFYCITDIQSDSDSWMLDSGASQHACSDASMFSSLEVADGSVMLGAETRCEVTGIGKVNLRMHDGEIHRLEREHLVPKLCKNLVSLGRLDSEGYNSLARHGVLTMMRGHTVLMRAVQLSKLYRLVGTAMRRGEPVVFAGNRVDSRGGVVDRPSVTWIRRVYFCDPDASASHK